MKTNIALLSLIILVSYACYRDVEVKHAVKPAVIINPTIYRFVGDVEIANAIAKSKYPKTLAAIAKVESEFKRDAIGDRGEAFGLFQIQQKHHGQVPADIVGQTKKAEGILDDLVRRRGYYQAIALYNGDGPASRRYRDKILNTMRTI
jgi:hypothetical protein